MRKLMLLGSFSLGYVLGTRAGRERYEQIMGTVNKVKNDPRVQEKTQQAVDVAKQQAPLVADKVTSAAGTATAAAKDKLGHSSDGVTQHHMAGPQGDLP
jgi:hypothetical protein